MGKLSLVTVALVKENMVGLGKIPFLKRNTDSISGCGFLGDGRDYCVCGIIPGLSLFIFLWEYNKQSVSCLSLPFGKAFHFPFGPRGLQKIDSFSIIAQPELNRVTQWGTSSD